MGRLIVVLATVMLWSCSGEETVDESVVDSPNILIIMVDDMGYSDIGCYGGEIPTPALDRLGNEGMRFTNFYNAGRCCPSRASLLTGLYPHSTGIGLMTRDHGVPAYRGFLNDECVTLAEVLGPAGYETYMSGKWHVGEEQGNWPLDRGFDHYFGLIGGYAEYFQMRDTATVIVDGNEPWEPTDTTYYLTNEIGGRAVEYIHDHFSNCEKKLFMMVNFTAPHWPLQAPEGSADPFIETYLAGWDAIRARRFERMKELGIIPDDMMSPRPLDVTPWDSVEDKQAWAELMAVYASMIVSVDEQVAEIMKALDENGQAENTIVIFLSDNGGSPEIMDDHPLNVPGAPIGSRHSYVSYKEPWANASNTPFRWYKEWMHEGGISTPMIVYWPDGIEGGAVTDATGHIMDIMPTLVELVGATYPREFSGNTISPLEGRSFAQLLLGSRPDEHEFLCWEHKGHRAVIKGQWKLVNRHMLDWELYDLNTDRTESKDLASTYPEVVQELDSIYWVWAEEHQVIPVDSILAIRVVQDSLSACCMNN